MVPFHKPRIVSVSRRTDIPAFYGEWFMNRVRAGWAVSCNPFNRRAMRVSLRPEDVGALVFWSKNFAPFLPYLAELKALGYRMVFLFTITGLPRIFETRVPDTGVTIAALQAMSRMFSPGHVLWRYDPVLLSSVTDEKYHLRRFRELCRFLSGYTTRCYISFVCLYPKVRRRLQALEKQGIKVLAVSEAEQAALARHLAEIAAEYGIELYSCCNDHLVGGPVKKAHCVDAELLSSLFNLEAGFYRIRPTRKQCGCWESVDIGMYDTCPHGCIYCYASTGTESSKNYLRHDPGSPALIMRGNCHSISGF
ncbi:MAG: hypothetical protein PWP72_395 [Thermoanaerobacter sp.]|nr:hypothetical protein [Thermoanaerobacter sp.]